MASTSYTEEAELFTNSTFQSSRIRDFPYHNLNHTQAVVKAAKVLANALTISATDKKILEIAAWFHDTGYSVKYVGHEGVSIQIATNFLHQKGASPHFIKSVAGCIKATEMPQNPVNMLEKIICDADLAHLSSPNFLQTQNGLRLEWEVYFKKVFTDKEWLANSLSFLNNHRYHSSYAQEHWEPEKLKNIQSLKNLMRS